MIEEERPAKRAKVQEGPFKVDLHTLHPRIDDLGRELRSLNVADRATLCGSYAIPLEVLPADTRRRLREELRTIPKPSMHMGHRVDTPWDLCIQTNTHMLLPRKLGVDLCGPAKTVAIVDVPVVFPEPAMPLLDAEAAEAVFKSDQVKHVTKLVADLQEMADGPAKFGAAIYSIPTGHGKGASVIHAAQKLGQRVLFVALSASLFDQFETEFKKFLGADLRVGRMWTSNKRQWKDADAPVVLTTVDSAATCKINTNVFGLVVVDESHLACTANRKKLFFRFPAKFVILLTATPERSKDHVGAYQEWLGGPISCYERVNFRNNRWGGVEVRDVHLRYKTPLIETFVQGIDGHEYTDGPAILAKAMYCHRRNNFVADYISSLVHNEGRHVVAFGVRIWHVEQIAKLLLERDTSAGVLVGTHTDNTVQTNEERARAKENRVLCAYVSLVVQALDMPRLDTIICVSGGMPWNNETFWIQLIGRIIRDKTMKNKPLIVLLRDDTTPKGYFSKQIDRAKKELRALGDGFDFVMADPNVTL